MKIIKEIEKSRLTVNRMSRITGGTGNEPESCTDEILHRTCGSVGGILYEVIPCVAKVICPSSYLLCGTSNKSSCSESFGLCNVDGLNNCPGAYME